MPSFPKWMLAGVGILLATSCAHQSLSLRRISPGSERPGPQSDGSILLPNQWSLRPAGRQISLGDFPVNVALHPDGRYAAVLHCGYGPHEVATIDLRTEKIISRVQLEEAFYGLAFSRDGSRLYVSGASTETVTRFQFSRGLLGEPLVFQINPVREKGIPSGIALSEEGQLYVANLRSGRVALLDSTAPNPTPKFVALTTNAPVLRDGKPLSEDEAAITKREKALTERALENDPFPYAVAVDDARSRLYVSLWAQSSVAVIDLATRKELGRWPTGDHPNELLLSRDRRRLFVANANHNSVTVIDTASGRALETLVAELEPKAPPGNTPNSLAFSPDEKLLFVANANINAVAVFEMAEPGKSRSIGFIPVGWYPTSVRVTPDGRKLIVANGKGLAPHANPHGPQPGRELPPSVREYIGGLLQGSLSFIDLPKGEKFDEQMKKWTAQAYQCRPLNPETERGGWDASNPIPRPGGKSPIKYCIYVIKENRTYDQVLGDLPRGNGDPTLCLFGEEVTPNHHQLAREFVLLDNFYVESEVSADGHEWSMAAYATDYVEKTWPLSYGHNQRDKYEYPSEGRFFVARPAGGYLWDRAKEAGVSYRSYGEFVDNGATPSQPATTRVKALQGHFDPAFRSFDMNYPDQKRADRFIAELTRFESEGQMPQLQIVRLPNDHTSGTSVGKPTPRAYVADNDLALGRVVEAVSHSRFWKETAIFVVEDDAQNGPDHVDAHRTIAYVISPYARRRHLDSTMYSTSSMLRTMELILGMKPMSQFDAAAVPMFRSFTAKPDLRPYKALPVSVDLNEKNPKLAWGSEWSEKMDFAREDAADDLLLNEIIWRSVRGSNSPMPSPVRAGFVFAEREDD